MTDTCSVKYRAQLTPRSLKVHRGCQREVVFSEDLSLDDRGLPATASPYLPDLIGARIIV